MLKTKLKKAGAGLLVMLPFGAFADGAAPLDLAATGTTVAGYIGTAATAGIAILGAMYGVRVIVRAFKAVK